MVDSDVDQLSSYVIANFVEVARFINVLHYVLSGAVYPSDRRTFL